MQCNCLTVEQVSDIQHPIRKYSISFAKQGYSYAKIVHCNMLAGCRTAHFTITWIGQVQATTLTFYISRCRLQQRETDVSNWRNAFSHHWNRVTAKINQELCQRDLERIGYWRFYYNQIHCYWHNRSIRWCKCACRKWKYLSSVR